MGEMLGKMLSREKRGQKGNLALRTVQFGHEERPIDFGGEICTRIQLGDIPEQRRRGWERIWNGGM